MRQVRFDQDAWHEFIDWQTQDRKIWLKIVDLINETMRTPFDGKGKPEPVKHEYKGYWSRRITQEHRLIYKATNEEIIIISCEGHY